MNRDSIDDIFKSGLEGRAFPNQDAVWQRLEQDLDKGRRKRPIAWLIVAALLIVGAGLTYLFYQPAANLVAGNSTTNASASAPFSKEVPGNNAVAASEVVKSTATAPGDLSIQDSKLNSAAGTNRLNASAPINNTNGTSLLDTRYVSVSNEVTSKRLKAGHKRITAATTKMLTTNASTADVDDAAKLANGAHNVVTAAIERVATNASPAEVNAGTNPFTTKLSKSAFNCNLLHVDAIASSPIQIPAVPVEQRLLPAVTASVATRTPAKKLNIELLAGSDIFHLNKQVGYYGGIRVVRNLDKGSAISFGVNYSLNVMSEKYRLSDKPFQQQQETDAQLNSMQMLRFPVMFQRQLAQSKFSLMAGLTPSYILGASVYNLPSTVTPGNPADYREFTIKDMNRFNVLFGAGLKYAIIPQVAIELSGSYGFTELVKDGYINQSNVNDNFRNIQVGVVFKLR